MLIKNLPLLSRIGQDSWTFLSNVAFPKYFLKLKRKSIISGEHCRNVAHESDNLHSPFSNVQQSLFLG